MLYDVRIIVMTTKGFTSIWIVFDTRIKVFVKILTILFWQYFLIGIKDVFLMKFDLNYLLKLFLSLNFYEERYSNLLFFLNVIKHL